MLRSALRAAITFWLIAFSCHLAYVLQLPREFGHHRAWSCRVPRSDAADALTMLPRRTHRRRYSRVEVGLHCTSYTIHTYCI